MEPWRHCVNGIRPEFAALRQRAARISAVR
jgi:hypothetical protein